MITYLLPFIMMLSSPGSFETTCPQPSNVHVTARDSGAISFDWDDCGCVANSYKVQYVRQSDNYQSAVLSTGSSNYDFSGLQAGAYEFYFWTDCGGADANEAIVIEDVIDN
jgi:hypothetical protein